MTMPRSPYDCIIVAYAYRDGNTRELFYAFDMEAAEEAEAEAVADQRFGRYGDVWLSAILLEP